MRCEIEVQKCLPDSCLNNGTCSVLDNLVVCDCSSTGFQGSTCETEIDECADITCLHGGQCVDEVQGYHCECPCAFTGDLCEEEVDFCRSSPCSEDTSMWCISVPNNCDYTCQCLAGWQGKHCLEEVDECGAAPCLHGACTDLLNDYSCACDEGYTGKDCDDPLDKCLVKPCLNGGACETVVDGQGRYFQCSCTDRYYGDTCQETRPPCYMSPCGLNGLCQPEGQQETCVCSDGFAGTFCEVNIDDCEAGPCKNGGECHDKIQDYSCTCVPGYGGKSCEALRDPCTTPDLCLNNATCTECTEEGCTDRYTCSCAPGFQGKDCGVDIDECAESPCVFGTCEDHVNEYQCSCDPGYEGVDCELEIDECDPNPCFLGNRCEDQVANYTCHCEGFTGRNCEVDVDECAENTGLCENGAACQNIPGSYTCRCLEGFGGEHCEREVLACDADPCENLSTCENTGPGTFACTCIGGYTGETCETPATLCNNRNNDCVFGVCVVEEEVSSCICDQGYTGEFCELELCSPGLCQNEGSCTNGAEGFRCLCGLPWVGRKCDKKANVLQFKGSSRAVLPRSGDEVKVQMGLKVSDSTKEQQVFEQDTSLGPLSLRIVDSYVQLTLEDVVLRVPIQDKFLTVSVDVIGSFVELIVGNRTEVGKLSGGEVSPTGDLNFGTAAVSAKREAISSFEGCFIDIGGLDLVNMAEGEGFGECGEKEGGSGVNDFDNLEEELPTLTPFPAVCQNGGNKVGPFCQCPPGFRGELCEIQVSEDCEALGCPGRCVETDRGPECVCAWPTHGEKCTEITVILSFKAESYLIFDLDSFPRADDEAGFEYSLEINPEYPRGIIARIEGAGEQENCTIFLDGQLGLDCGSLRVDHPAEVPIDSWTLIRLHFYQTSVLFSVNHHDELYSKDTATPFSFDGPIVFGSIPDAPDSASSLPGFFGEIYPITINRNRVDLRKGMGWNVLPAKSRDLATPHRSGCDADPCGSGTTCYDRIQGYGCLCDQYNAKSECNIVPSLLTFLHPDSYAHFTIRPQETNVFVIKFKSSLSSGVLLYSADTYKNDPSTYWSLNVLEGTGVQFKLYTVLEEEGEVSNEIYQDIVPGAWNEVKVTIHPQKVELRVNGRWNELRVRLPRANLLPKSSVYVGGVKGGGDWLVGQVSELTHNGKSLMGSFLNTAGSLSC